MTVLTQMEIDWPASQERYECRPTCVDEVSWSVVMIPRRGGVVVEEVEEELEISRNWAKTAQYLHPQWSHIYGE